MYNMNLAHSAHCITPLEVQAGTTPDNTHIRKGTPEGTKIFKSHRYMDSLVGRIVDTVEKQGLLDNTIIIYTSDNGTTSSSKVGKGVE